MCSIDVRISKHGPSSTLCHNWLLSRASQVRISDIAIRRETFGAELVRLLLTFLTRAVSRAEAAEYMRFH